MLTKAAKQIHINSKSGFKSGNLFVVRNLFSMYKIAKVAIDATYEACPEGNDLLAWLIPFECVTAKRFQFPISSVPWQTYSMLYWVLLEVQVMLGLQTAKKFGLGFPTTLLMMEVTSMVAAVLHQHIKMILITLMYHRWLPNRLSFRLLLSSLVVPRWCFL